MEASATFPELSPTTVANHRVQKLFLVVILLIAFTAISLTHAATKSDEMIFQVLSQTELVLAQSNINNSKKESSPSPTQRHAIVHEPYGYAIMKDDTDKNGWRRYLFRACFYEYRLPRAFLKVSRYREVLTDEESKEIMYRAGVTKRPLFWNPFAANRNVFLEEPYRDKTIDWLFTYSYCEIITGLLAGVLAVLGLAFLCRSIQYYEGYNHLNLINAKHTVTTTKTTDFSIRTGVRCPKRITSSSLCNTLCRWFRTPVILGRLLLGLTAMMATATILPAVAVGTLLHNDTLCGRRCASSLESKDVLEVDACIEKCVPGEGAKLALQASCLWLFASLLVGGVTFVSVISARAPSVSSSLSKRWWWWNDICLPLAIREEQLCPRSLPHSIHSQ